ncbi:helix-turn-helix domain-containing protein [Candidatus Uhrbacteria bacterium]|nr:helix-turn-helix domain-containing protein [Candidatus Uhrbacteria bacterium]
MSFAVKRLDHEERLGDKLYAMRRALNCTLDDMARMTKIQKCYLQAFEKGTYGALPESRYARPFLKTYVQALNGRPAYFLARFDSEHGDKQREGEAVSCLPRKKIGRFPFFALHRLWRLAAGSLLVLALVGYMGLQMHRLWEPPGVVVYEPTDDLATSEATVTVRGQTDAEVELFVNGMKVLPGSDGTFSTPVPLERGLNLITIEGATRHSRKTVVYRKVVLEQQPTDWFGALSTPEPTKSIHREDAS